MRYPSNNPNPHRYIISVWVVLAAFNFFCLYFTIFAQSQSASKLDNLIKRSQFIFEGKVIKDSAFYGPDKSTIYTANTLIISKIFKGNLQCGNAEIVTFGGTLDSITQWGPDVLQLKSGISGIFICVKSAFPTVSAPFENPIALSVFEYEDYLGYLKRDSTVYAYPNPNFRTHVEAYNYLQKINEQVYVSCLSDTFISSNFKYYPNPVLTDLTIRFSGSELATIEIYDMLGRKVLDPKSSLDMEQVFEIKGNQKVIVQKVDLTVLKQAAYIARVRTKDHLYSFKLIKL